MKYALSFLLFSFVFSAEMASARTITSFRDSDAISTLAQFIYDVAEDVPVSVRLSDKKINIKDFSECKDVSASLVLGDIETSIKKVLRYYPDDDVPFLQALIDMEDYLDGRTYKKCVFEKKSAQSKTISTYYADLSNKIHVRLDNVLLIAE